MLTGMLLHMVHSSLEVDILTETIANIQRLWGMGQTSQPVPLDILYRDGFFARPRQGVKGSVITGLTTTYRYARVSLTDFIGV